MRLAHFLLLSPALMGAAWAAGTSGNPPQTAEQVRTEVRKAVEAHRAQERDDIRREEAEVGRRLTPAERSELREQIRYQWLLPSKPSSIAGKADKPEKPDGPAGSNGPAPGAAQGTRFTP